MSEEIGFEHGSLRTLCGVNCRPYSFGSKRQSCAREKNLPTCIGWRQVAQKALEKTSRYLGIGLANVIWGLDADAVVIDAAMNEAWALVRPAIQNQFPTRSDVVVFRNLILRPSSLGGDAAIIGAATLPFKTLFALGELQAPRRTEIRQKA